MSERSGKLTVIAELGMVNRCRMVRVRCDCGNEKDVRSNDIKRGRTKSCGCVTHRNAPIAYTRSATSSRRIPTPTYCTYVGMRSRCCNPKNKSYARYGGRGIAVCDQWRTFDGFLADMGERPDGTQLDRIDNSKGYEKSNCRWASLSVQRLNQRRPKPSGPRRYVVSVPGYDDVQFEADTKDKARYRGYLAYRDAIGSGVTLKDFTARGVRVRLAKAGSWKPEQGGPS